MSHLIRRRPDPARPEAESGAVNAGRRAQPPTAGGDDSALAPAPGRKEVEASKLCREISNTNASMAGCFAPLPRISLEMHSEIDS
jgi:hypothetical protein